MVIQFVPSDTCRLCGDAKSWPKKSRTMNWTICCTLVRSFVVFKLLQYTSCLCAHPRCCFYTQPRTLVSHSFDMAVPGALGDYIARNYKRLLICVVPPDTSSNVSVQEEMLGAEENQEMPRTRRRRNRRQRAAAAERVHEGKTLVRGM